MKMRKTLLKWFVISLLAVMMFVFGGIDGRHLYSTYVGEVNTAVSSDQKAGTGDCLAVHADCGLNGDVNILIWRTWRHGQVLLARRQREVYAGSKDGGNWYQYCYNNPLRYWVLAALAGLYVYQNFGLGGRLDTAASMNYGRGGVIAQGESGTRYTPANPGPLSQDEAETFTGGSYTETVLTKDTTFYRVYGGVAEKVGRFLSRTPQNGGMQSQMDLALNPEWGNTAEYVIEVVVPKGTTIYEGTAAQTIYGGAGILLGGGSQVYIPEVDASWFGN